MGSNPIGVIVLKINQFDRIGTDEEMTLSKIELETVDWLIENFELKLKDFFLADLSWADNQEERDQAFVDFFTKRKGKRLLEILPEDIKNYVLARSL
jgi:hypothetical protein